MDRAVLAGHGDGHDQAPEATGGAGHLAGAGDGVDPEPAISEVIRRLDLVLPDGEGIARWRRAQAPRRERAWEPSQVPAGDGPRGSLQTARARRAAVGDRDVAAVRRVRRLVLGVDHVELALRHRAVLDGGMLE